MWASRGLWERAVHAGARGLRGRGGPEPGSSSRLKWGLWGKQRGHQFPLIPIFSFCFV